MRNWLNSTFSKHKYFYQAHSNKCQIQGVAFAINILFLISCKQIIEIQFQVDFLVKIIY